MASSSMMNADYVKPLAAAGVAILLDKFVLNQQDMNSSLYFGASTGAGVLVAGLLASYLPDISGTIKTTSFYNANTVEKRLLEIGLAAGGSYAVNNLILKNTSYTNEDLMKRLAVVVASDFISEYMTDYATAQPLSYLI